MSSVKSKIFKWSLLTLLLAYTVVICAWAHKEARQHVCTGIEIHTSSSKGSAMDSVIRHGVSEELKEYPQRIVGTPLHQLKTSAIEKYLSGLNNFESVHCMISSRGKLVIEVVPLIPVMRVFFGDNSYYINKDGKYITSNAEFFSDVPVVSGQFSKTFPPRSVLPLVNFINHDNAMRDLTGMIIAENAHNLLIVPRVRGHVVNFGDTTRLDEKKRALLLFYRQVMPYKGWEEYDTISVKYRGQVIATRRNKEKLNHAEEYFEDIDLEEATLPDAGDEATPAQKQETKSQREL